MDPVQLIQLAFRGLLNGGDIHTGNASAATNATSTPMNAGLPVPLNISGLLSLLLSFAALRDWIKLFIIGGAIETARRFVMSSWTSLLESFWITACFDDNDTSYNWILYWLSKNSGWGKARTVNVSTRSFGLTSPATVIHGDDDDDDDGRRLCYLPSFSRTYSLWYKGHYIRFTRSQAQEGAYSTREVLQLEILAWNHSVLEDLLLEAKKLFKQAEEHLVSVFVSESGGNWRHVASRPKRPLTSIVLEPGIKSLLLEDAQDFLQSKDWYIERGIPFRRGYLLYGAPGSGKTSIIQSLAGELGLDVYVISLSRIGLDDASLSALISDLPERCIALMEDIDAAFHHGLTRNLQDEDESESSDEEGNKSDRGEEKEKASTSSPLCRVTLSGLLNALDGIGAQEGRILYATTNCYSALDSALIRPGRMDLHVEFKLASYYQAHELFKCFYLPSHSKKAQPEVINEKGDVKEQTDHEASTNAELEDHDSAYSSASPSNSSAPSENGDAAENKSTKLYVGNMHRLTAPKLSYSQISALAQRFADAIPEREFSMASLQGYLMSFKTRPVEAAAQAESWVAKERAEKAKKSKNAHAHAP